MLKNEVTAKSLVTHPENFKRNQFFLLSPYTGKTVVIVDAVKSGQKVLLTTDDGLSLCVEAMRKLTKEKKRKK